MQFFTYGVKKCIQNIILGIAPNWTRTEEVLEQQGVGKIMLKMINFETNRIRTDESHV